MKQVSSKTDDLIQRMNATGMINTAREAKDRKSLFL